MALLRRARAEHGGPFPGFADLVEIGAGRLSTVYRAREIATDRLVALKVLHLPASAEPVAREPVPPELGAVSSHPHVVTLFRSFRAADGGVVLVLELCRGPVLRPGQRLTVADAVAIGIKIAGAIETAHRAGIVHGDVGTRHILLTEFGEPVLSGLGSAALRSRRARVAAPLVVGPHEAPELLTGGPVGPAADVYGLASTLHELLAGRPAFRLRPGESPELLALRIRHDPVRPLAGPHVPRALAGLLARAMAKDPGARPDSAARFGAELVAVEVGLGLVPTRLLVPAAADGEDTATPPRMTDRPVVVEQIIHETVLRQPVVEQQMIVETAVEEPAVAELAVEEPAVAELAVEEPVVEEPVVEEPVVEQQMIVETAVDEPVAGELAVEELEVEELAVEELAVEEMASDAPIADPPAVSRPAPPPAPPAGRSVVRIDEDPEDEHPEPDLEDVPAYPIPPAFGAAEQPSPPVPTWAVRQRPDKPAPGPRPPDEARP